MSKHGDYQSKISIKNGVKKKKSTQEKLSQRCIRCHINKVTDPSTRVKNASSFFYYEFCWHFLSNTLLHLIHFWCLIFNESPWWSIWRFFFQTPLNFWVKLLKSKWGKIIKKNILWPIKNFPKYFIARQYKSKIFPDPCRNPLVLLPIYLMYSP